MYLVEKLDIYKGISRDNAAQGSNRKETKSHKITSLRLPDMGTWQLTMAPQEQW